MGLITSLIFHSMHALFSAWSSGKGSWSVNCTSGSRANRAFGSMPASSYIAFSLALMSVEHTWSILAIHCAVSSSCSFNLCSVWSRLMLSNKLLVSSSISWNSFSFCLKSSKIAFVLLFNLPSYKPNDWDSLSGNAYISSSVLRDNCSFCLSNLFASHCFKRWTSKSWIMLPFKFCYSSFLKLFVLLDS